MLSEITDGNLFFDISNIIAYGDPYPYHCYQEILRRLCNHVDAYHVVWEKHLPGTLLSHSYQEMLLHLRDSGYFSVEELKYILGDTATYAYRILANEN